MGWYLEAFPDRHAVVAMRAKIDCRLGILGSALHLTKGSFNGSEEKPLYFPQSSGRVLLTGKYCITQAAHTDFSVETDGNPGDCAKFPRYFFIATGRNSTPIWICDRSHHLLIHTDEEIEKISSVIRMNKKTIPPHSVLVMSWRCRTRRCRR